MADGTVRVNFAADVSDVRKGTQQVVKEIDKVNKAADKSAAGAARSSSKALSGIIRLIQTGEVSSKKLDKIGKSASGLLSGLSSVGVGLGLGALPLASDIAVAAIRRIQRANESLTDRINQSAAAMRQANIAQRAAEGSIDAITAADLSAADAHKALNEARRAGNTTAAEMTRLELAASAADRDAATAREASATAIIEARKESDKYAGAVQSVIDKSLKLTDATQSGRAMILDSAASVDTVVSALRKHAQAADGLTNAERGAERALADYIETTGEVPADIKTVLALLGQGKSIADIRRFLGLTDKIPPKKTVEVSTPGAARAALQLANVKRYLDGLHNKTIDVTTRHFNRGEVPTSATGSMVAGRFDGKDNIPVMVSKGEAILNPRQINLVNSGMTVEGALGATGGKTIRAGGSYASGGGKAKHGLDYRKAAVAVEAAKKRLREAEKKYGKGSLQARQAQVALDSAEERLRKASGKERDASKTRAQERTQKVLDTAKDRFGATMSSDDLALAKAERTPGKSDDAVVLKSQQRHIISRIQEIRRLRKRKGLTRAQRQDLNDEEASLIRQLTDIGGQLAPDSSGDGASDSSSGGADPFEVDRARQAGFNEGRGRLEGYVFGGSGDIGRGGANALLASGSIPAVHIENVTFTNSVQNQAQIAKAGNVGNDVLSGGRIRSSREAVAF